MGERCPCAVEAHLWSHDVGDDAEAGEELCVELVVGLFLNTGHDVVEECSHALALRNIGGIDADVVSQFLGALDGEFRRSSTLVARDVVVREGVPPAYLLTCRGCQLPFQFLGIVDIPR